MAAVRAASARVMLVRTGDHCTYAVPEAVARECDTLVSAAAVADGVVPVPNVTSAHLARVVQFYVQSGELRVEDADEAARRAWSARFFDRLPRADLFGLMEAANYLGACELLDDACAHVADLVSGRAPEEIRQLLLLPRDRTDEEVRARAAELAWAR